jgi:hypothetical protein
MERGDPNHLQACHLGFSQALLGNPILVLDFLVPEIWPNSDVTLHQ